MSNESKRDLVAEFKALLAAGLEQSACLAALHDHGEQFPTYAAQVDTDDDLEVDAKPLFSAGDDGVWVSAWVHVPHPAEEDAGCEGNGHPQCNRVKHGAEYTCNCSDYQAEPEEGWSCDNCGETAQDGTGICITCNGENE